MTYQRGQVAALRSVITPEDCCYSRGYPNSVALRGAHFTLTGERPRMLTDNRQCLLIN